MNDWGLRFMDPKLTTNMTSDTNMTFLDSIDETDLFHQQIYTEWKLNNSRVESLHHVLSVSGSLISVFGIIGNLISLFILFKPSSTTFKFPYRDGHRARFMSRRKLGSFEYKLSSFYCYLKALSLCDFFSCIFAILNVLEYLIPPISSTSMMKYRLFCSSLSIYTHPIATTLQALSVWIICAFSIHRCRSIVRPSTLLSSFRKEILKRNSVPKNVSSTDEYDEKKSDRLWARLKSFFSSENAEKPCSCCMKNKTRDDSRDYFFQISFKNNINQQSYYLKFYKQSIACIFNKCFNGRNRTKESSTSAINECPLESGAKAAAESGKKMPSDNERSCLMCFCSCKKQSEIKECLRSKSGAQETTTDAPRPSQAGNDTIIKMEEKQQPASMLDFSRQSFKRLSMRYKFSSSSLTSLNRTRYTITGLYIVAIVYLIPQMFEKKSVTIQFQRHVYFYKEITEFGQSRLYRHFYHLWFYLFAIYILPFTFIFISNLLLLRVYLKSKKRCQRYHMRSSTMIFREATSNSISTQNPNIMRDSNNFNMNLISEQNPNRSANNIAFSNDHSTSSSVDHTNASAPPPPPPPPPPTQPIIASSVRKNRLSVNLTERHLSFAKRPNLERSASLISDRSGLSYFRRRSFRFGSRKGKLSSASAASNNGVGAVPLPSNSNKPSRALTMTLFGVVAIFFVCNMPAAIARIIYVVYPQSEFQNKNITAVYMGVANFLIMLNSSVNFIPYIVFGPGKFREEFRIVCFSILNAFLRCFDVFRICSLFRRKSSNAQTFTTATSTVLGSEQVRISRLNSCEGDNDSQGTENRPRLGSLI